MMYFLNRVGGKLVCGFGVMLAIVASFLSPPAARLSPYALMVMRFINGVGQVGCKLLLANIRLSLLILITATAHKKSVNVTCGVS